MFSYRHVFHAGNHADVLKHLALVATARHLMLKSAPLLLVDTHAGAGIYRLDGDMAATSGESADGVLRLLSPDAVATGSPGSKPGFPSALADYLDVLHGFAAESRDPAAVVYPGSPFILYHLMQAPERAAVHDRLKLFELHPTDSRLLVEHIKQLRAGNHITVEHADGFEALKRLLPPATASGGSRRALVLIDPSYEIKTDYAKVGAAVRDALTRFASGVFFIWYPIIPRVEAHELPRRLKTLAREAKRSWLQASLSVGVAPAPAATAGVPSDRRRAGLSGSGIFVINPPYTLADNLRASLPRVAHALARGAGQGWSVEQGD